MRDLDAAAVAITTRGTTRWRAIDAADLAAASTAELLGMLETMFDHSFEGWLEITVIENDGPRKPQRVTIPAAWLNGHDPAEKARMLDELLGRGYEGRLEIQVLRLRTGRPKLRSL